MSEASEQIKVVEYCDLLNIPVFHIPNQRRCDPKTGAHLKRQGLRPGVPDLCIPRAASGFHALYIEMKDRKGKLTRLQLEWINKLRAEGNCAYCCYGAESAIRLIKLYLSGQLATPEYDSK